MEKKNATFPNDYNKNEPAKIMVSNKIVTQTVITDLKRCPPFRIIDAVFIIANTWGLNPKIEEDFSVIKRILYNSILNN